MAAKAEQSARAHVYCLCGVCVSVVCVRVHLYDYVYTCVYVCAYVCVYVCVCVCNVCLCMTCASAAANAKKCTK